MIIIKKSDTGDKAWMKKMHFKLSLGSLFDGVGTFPFAGMMCGIEPIWASEIEPLPIRVTEKRLPTVKHYGNISKLNGSNLEPVDIITFGSPCQNLSIAGNRQGLAGKKSSLFYEAIRIIEEMREATNGRYPRFAVWENVKGAFSSNKGADFEEVLRMFCKVKGTEMPISRPKKWEHAGCILGGGYSIAWRLFDAQFWGVPQRRERIYLVADFGGNCAGKILFESEGLSRYSAKSFLSRQEVAGSIAEGAGETITVLNDQGGGQMSFSEDVSGTLRAQEHGHQPCVVTKKPQVVYCLQGNGIDRADTAGCNGRGWCEDISYTLNTIDRPAVVYDARGNGDGGVVPTITGDHENRITDYTALCSVNNSIVRRLTPLECARLQGMPDWWCDDLGDEDPSDEEIQKWIDIFKEYSDATGRKSKPKTVNQIKKWLKNPYSDSAAYKMWGNGCAFPNVEYILAGISQIQEIRHG